MRASPSRFFLFSGLRISWSGDGLGNGVRHGNGEQHCNYRTSSWNYLVSVLFYDFLDTLKVSLLLFFSGLEDPVSANAPSQTYWRLQPSWVKIADMGLAAKQA